VILPPTRLGGWATIDISSDATFASLWDYFVEPIYIYGTNFNCTNPDSCFPTLAFPPFLSHWFDPPSAIEWSKTFLRFGGCPSSRITTHLIDFSGALFTFHTSAYCPHLREGELKEKQPEQHFLVFILLSCFKALCYRPSSLDKFTQSETFLSFTAFVEVLIDPILKHIGRSYSRSNLRLSIPGKISANKNLYFVAGGGGSYQLATSLRQICFRFFLFATLVWTPFLSWSERVLITKLEFGSWKLRKRIF